MYYDPFQLILGKSPHHDKKKNHKKKILTEDSQWSPSGDQLKKIKIKKLKEKIKLKKKKKIEDAKHKHVLIEDTINLEKEKPDNNVYIDNHMDIEYGDKEDFNDPKKLKKFEKAINSVFEYDEQGNTKKDNEGMVIIKDEEMKALTQNTLTKFPMMKIAIKQLLKDADLEDPEILFKLVLWGNISKDEYDEKKKRFNKILEDEKEKKGIKISENDK